MIYIDIDDVLRDLNKEVFGEIEPKVWNSKTKYGLDCVETVNNNLDILIKAKPTKYFKTIINFFKQECNSINLLSVQQDNWVNNTNLWIEKNIKPIIKNVNAIYCKPSLESDGKLLHLKKYDLLVDDSPNFTNYNKIILIHKYYNKNIKVNNRIKFAYQLEKILRQYYL